jgi:adhesin transport system membrane fusion protein
VTLLLRPGNDGTAPVTSPTAWTPAEPLPASRLVLSPMSARRTARLLAGMLAAFTLACIVSPWQQSVRGDGEVVAFDPAERPITVEAPTTGVVRQWHVEEGDDVIAGQLLVSLTDNDPAQLDRLRAQRDAAQAAADRKADGVVSLEASLVAAQVAADAKVAAAEAKADSVARKLQGLERKVEAARAGAETARLNRERIEKLAGEGLNSERSLELAVLGDRKARAELEVAEAERDGAVADLAGARGTRDEVEANAFAKLRELESKLDSARAEAAEAGAKAVELDTKLARQETQQVTAPRDGTVLRLLVAQGSEQVKQGDGLLSLVPPRVTPHVALVVDGNDAALLDPGRTVRVQFEGWPAVQFVGWPSVAAGTFGGVVDFIDSASDGSGDFRVIVLPDPLDEPWPPTDRLRPGVRAHGWVLLEQVPLGFELWRQLNGFPPSVPAPDSVKKGGK